MSGTKKVLVKIIIIGESGVGKTALLHKYVMNKFIEEHKATIGADFLTKDISIGDKLITLQIWDTAGQERFQSMSSAFWRGANACIMIYDITNKESFESINKWRDNLLREIDPEQIETFPLLLIGNKSDLSDEKREVPRFDANNYAQQYQMLFYETSALNGFNINPSIQELAKAAIKVYKHDIPYLEPVSNGDPDLYTAEIQELEEFKAQPNYCACQLL
mmetsp:Transcript_72256/g.64940  ORF Transcript_72256/g.64940 Transcript_72256/m.64940 type:complete len:219 (+) Transcript_72256:167-823(+)